MTSLLKAPSGHQPAAASGRVSSHWKLLKSFINSDEQENGVKGVDVDTSPKVISHGMHYQGKINLKHAPGEEIRFVALNSTLHCYAIINNKGKIIVAMANGRVKRIKSDECYKGMIFATKSKQCICWGNSDKLKVTFYLTCAEIFNKYISILFDWFNSRALYITPTPPGTLHACRCGGSK